LVSHSTNDQLRNNNVILREMINCSMRNQFYKKEHLSTPLLSSPLLYSTLLFSTLISSSPLLLHSFYSVDSITHISVCSMFCPFLSFPFLSSPLVSCPVLACSPVLALLSSPPSAFYYVDSIPHIYIPLLLCSSIYSLF
jgi:hypothetical protein